MSTPYDHRAANQIKNGNLIGIAAMLGAMAAFVANDTCVKLIGSDIPLGELILLRSIGATALVLSYAWLTGGFALPSQQHWPLITWRVVADVFATLCIVAGVLGLPIADATAISQVTPLAMTATAAIVLKEAVGWRRWTAIIIGFIGRFDRATRHSHVFFASASDFRRRCVCRRARFDNPAHQLGRRNADVAWHFTRWQLDRGSCAVSI